VWWGWQRQHCVNAEVCGFCDPQLGPPLSFADQPVKEEEAEEDATKTLTFSSSPAKPAAVLPDLPPRCMRARAQRAAGACHCPLHLHSSRGLQQSVTGRGLAWRQLSTTCASGMRAPAGTSFCTHADAETVSAHMLI
jgi:hypothetical protein